MKNFIITALFTIVSITSFAQAKKRFPTREEELNNAYCSGLFSTIDGTYFDFISDENTASASSYINILDWMQGRVAGLQIYNFRGNRVPFIRNNPAAVFVDEMRVDAGFLDALSVNDIAMIKVIKTPFLGGWGGSGGAIAIYTKDGDEGETNSK